MKKCLLYISCLSLVLFFSSAYAEINPKDLCSQLPGFWQGATHLKNQADCNASNGCTHLVTVSSEHIDADKYHVRLTFTDGVNAKEQELDATCKDGSIILPISIKYSISSSCDKLNHCFIVYDDVRFSAELIKT